jgi:Ca-activated chloride channel homolog
MQNLSFAYPFILGLLLIIPLLFFLWRKKNEPAQMWSNFSMVQKRANFKERLRKYLFLLPLLASLFLILALARPQMKNIAQTLDGRGIDIVLSIDISGSMLSKDFQPNRLEAAKQTAETFVLNRPADRISLVIFSGESFTICPPTLDKNILSEHLQNLQSGQLAGGSAIGMGLATAVDKLKESKAKSKIVILMTDGVSSPGLIDPYTALEIAKTYQVKVYTIGMGTDGRALTPTGRDVFGEWVYEYQEVEIDEELLTKIATETGGKYYHATDQQVLNKIYQEIDQLEKSDVKVKTFVRIKELFKAPLGIGMFLLFLFLFLKLTFLRSLVDD